MDKCIYSHMCIYRGMMATGIMYAQCRAWDMDIMVVGSFMYMVFIPHIYITKALVPLYTSK